MEEDSDILWSNGITQQADNSRENQVVININCATRGHTIPECLDIETEISWRIS